MATRRAVNRCGAYWDPNRGLTRRGRTKHIPVGGLWDNDNRDANVSLCGKPIPRAANSWATAYMNRECQACQRIQNETN